MDSHPVTAHDKAEKKATPWWRCMLGRLGAAAGIGLVSSVPTVVAAQNVPQHWIAYAQLASHQLQDRLSDGADETVARLHQWLAKNDLGTTSVVVQLWIAPNGQVSKVDFAPLGDESADKDLHHLLVSTVLTEPPPQDMAQPLHLSLSLEMQVETGGQGTAQ